MASNQAVTVNGKVVEFVISAVRSREDLTHAISLITEYTSWLDLDLKFQDFELEMANMPGKYAPPAGELLLAKTSTGIMAGCVALRKLEDGICEMKRLWVRDLAKGTGLGRRLVIAIVQTAKSIGYQKMRLDTLPRMESAIRLYRSIGFVDVAPYYVTPLADTQFLELDLSTVNLS